MTDGTVGNAGHLGAPQAFTGPEVKITQDMGTTKGQNVFQSFKEFNIGSGQTVTFTENSTNFVNNVIARVTGKDTSNINGTLSVTPGGHANFYLLNPNGVMFGHGAQIDVPGDFHVTTAHFVKFQDGAKYGSDPVHSYLSSTEPASFGFSSSSHSNNVLIDVTDGAQLKNPTTPNTVIDLVAQNIKIENGAAVSANDVRLVAAKGNTSVSLSHDVYGNLSLPIFEPTATNAGNVRIIGNGQNIFWLEPNDNQTTVTGRAYGGGRVAVWGGGVKISNGSVIDSVETGTAAPSPSSGVTLKASSLRVESGGLIKTEAEVGLNATGLEEYAGISIHAGGGVYVSNSYILSKSVNAWARNVIFSGGSSVSVNDLMIKSSGLLSISNSSLHAAAGNINLQADYIQLLNKAYISAGSSDVSPDAGEINLVSRRGIVLKDLSEINGIGGSFGMLGRNNYGNKISIIDGGGLFVVGGSRILTYKEDLNTPYFSVSHDNNISKYGGEIDISARYLYLDHGCISAYTTSNGGAVKLLNLEQIFAIGGKINGYPYYSSGYKVDGHKYINDGFIRKYDGPQFNMMTPARKSVENIIAIQNNGIGNSNIVLSGALLNLSGAMSSLPPANFQSKEIPNSCQVANTGNLSLSGKGRTSFSALDHVIYGY